MIKKLTQFAFALVCGLLLGQYVPKVARAAAGYLASGVNFDSALTAQTVVYRDTDSTSYLALENLTTTQLAARTDPVGTIFLAQESVAGALVSNTFNLCASTAAAIQSYVYISVSTSAQAVVGANCKS